jgi:hypothetical protein
VEEGTLFVYIDGYNAKWSCTHWGMVAEASVWMRPMCVQYWHQRSGDTMRVFLETPCRAANSVGEV